MNGSGPSQQTISSQTATLPSWLNGASEQAVQQGEALSTRAYTPYTGQAVAPLSANEQTAANNAGSMSTAYQPLIASGGQAFNSKNLQPYMNPYTQGALGVQAGRINQQYDQQQNALTSGLEAQNALGSNRAQIVQNNLNTNRQNSLNDMESAGLSNAYSQGTGAFFNNAQDAQAAAATVNGQLEQTGNTEQQIAQAQDTFNYNQFIQGRDWSVNNMAPLLSAIGGSRTDQTMSGTGANYSSQSNLGSIISGGSALAGAALLGYNALNQPGGSALNQISQDGTDYINDNFGTSAGDEQLAGDMASYSPWESYTPD